MKRRKKLFLVAGLLALPAAGFLIIYLAYPRVLLSAVIMLQRSKAGVEHQWVQVEDWNLPWIGSQTRGKDDRETILLVHGFGDSKDSFLDLVAGLTDDYRIVAFDLPGFGESAVRMDEDYSATFYVRVILEFLDQLEIDSVHLVGYSMGGMLATKLASQSPDRVRSLTLLAPAGLPGSQPSEMDRMVADGKGNPLTYRDRPSFDRLVWLNFNHQLDVPEFVIRAVVSEGRERADLHEHIFSRLFNPADSAEFEKEIAALTIPTNLIWGTEDRILNVSAADHWTQMNPEIRVLIIPQVGHDLIHQRVDKVREVLRAQIREVTPER